MPYRQAFDIIEIMDAEKGGFDMSVYRAPCGIENGPK